MRRFRFVLAITLCIALLAIPLVALATVWASEYPFGVITASPAVVSVDAYGNIPIVVLRVDGIALHTTRLHQDNRTTLSCAPGTLGSGTHKVKVVDRRGRVLDSWSFTIR